MNPDNQNPQPQPDPQQTPAPDPNQAVSPATEGEIDIQGNQPQPIAQPVQEAPQPPVEQPAPAAPQPAPPQPTADSQRVTTPTSLQPKAPNAPATPVAAPEPAPTPQPTPPADVYPTPKPQAPAPGATVQPSGDPNVPPTVVPATKEQADTTQNALQLAEIRDGVVIMNDGSFRSVVRAKSINFDLMSPEERDSVEFAYQGFLNSLYFKVQIFIRSNRVDIRPYLEKLDKLRLEHDNMLLALLMEDYINFIGALSEETNIMDKEFYVVIPYYPPVTTAAVAESGKKLFGNLFSAFRQNQSRPVITIDEKTLTEAKTELANRVQATVGGLLNVGVQSVALDTRELSELFYNVYNPDTATRQHLADISQLNSLVVKKGSGQAPNPNFSSGSE